MDVNFGTLPVIGYDDIDISFLKSGESVPWTPAELFKGGEDGVWYDPADLATLFTDAAGTIPVTSDGDPVGKHLDKSGNGNNLTQSISTARPTFKTDGSSNWVLPDGIDDRMMLDSVVIAESVYIEANFFTVASTEYIMGANNPDNLGIKYDGVSLAVTSGPGVLDDVPWVATDAFVKICFVYESPDWSVYVDGVKIVETAASVLQLNIAAMYSRGGSDFPTGIPVREVILLDRPFTLEEILNLQDMP